MNRNNNQYVATVYVDLKKAFNTVNHSILIQKMIKLGFPNNFIILLTNYLENRSQLIKLGDCTSTRNFIHDGVPQGSIVGPSLFLCYINDLKHVNIEGYLSLYADDTSITVAADSVEKLTDIMNHNLDLFYNWCICNKLNINIKKNKVLPYYTCRQKNFLKGHAIVINNEALEQVDNYTYLGIRMDAHLTMKNHLEFLYRAALPMVYSLASIRKFIGVDTAILIFKAHILSRLEYGSTLCVGANNLYLDRLQKLVNKSLRICFHLPRDANVFKMHSKAKVLPLKIRRNKALLKLMFNRTTSIQNDMSLSPIRRQTRSNTVPKLHIPFPRTEAFRRSVTFQGPARWLALPKYLKLCDSMEEFNKEIREWYVTNFLENGVI